MMVAREQLLAALWWQTDDLLQRTRRQIEALSARESTARGRDRREHEFRRDAQEGDGHIPTA